MARSKTYAEINEKIRKGEAVVVTAEEITKMAKTLTPAELVEQVDVVTTATFGPMCSSGAFINFGHSEPTIRMEKASLNDVPVCAGIAAVDAYIGATETSTKDEKYGGAHVLCDLIEGKDLTLKATAKGTDCYPRKEIETIINKDNVNEIIMFNPRNAYQNYCVATNTSEKIKYTYMGSLLPGLGNATYSTSGELSPLLNDPEMRTIGIGTRIFLCGTEGYVSWHGTQFNSAKPVNDKGIPLSNAATLAVIGDLKKMDREYIAPAYYEKYGVSLFVGIGIPIPVLDEEMVKSLTISNKDIETTVVDYGTDGNLALGIVNYEQLQSGTIEIGGKKIRTAPMASLYKARKIAEELKDRIKKGVFFITEPVELFPKNKNLNSLEIRGEK